MNAGVAGASMAGVRTGHYAERTISGDGLGAQGGAGGRYHASMSTRTSPAQIGDLPPIGRPATSALVEAGIGTLAQVAACSRSELLAMHGMGPKAIRILEDALQAQGLRFAD